MTTKQAPRQWRVAEAKEKFSEMLRRAAEAPQQIFSRDRLVTVVLGSETFERFETWNEQQDRVTLGEAFAGLRALCSEEGYVFEIPRRMDRANVFADTVEDVSR